jgi:replication factor C subunit 3/5
MLLTDKYCPNNLKNSYFHHDIIKIIEKLKDDSEIPSIIFYGPEGSGKKTLIKLLLKAIYGDNVLKTRNVNFNILGSANKINEVTIKESDYHMVIEPNNNNFDRYLIQDLIMKYAERKQINFFVSNINFKTVVINNIDKMSYFAQTSLRRTMEKYSKNCRFIMWCHSLSKVIQPLISRCITINVPSPNNNDIFRYLLNISSKENIKLKINQIDYIIHNSKGNIKTCLWYLQMIKFGVKCDDEYEEMNKDICDIIMKNSLKDYYKIRELLYNILSTNIDVNEIITNIVLNICNRDIPEIIKFKIINQASIVTHNINRARREIIHLDHFILYIMNELNEK